VKRKKTTHEYESRKKQKTIEFKDISTSSCEPVACSDGQRPHGNADADLVEDLHKKKKKKKKTELGAHRRVHVFARPSVLGHCFCVSVNHLPAPMESDQTVPPMLI